MSDLAQCMTTSYSGPPSSPPEGAILIVPERRDRRGRRQSAIYRLGFVAWIGVGRDRWAIVDVADVPHLMGVWQLRRHRKWRSCYAQRAIPGRCGNGIDMHRVLLNPQGGLEVDHINGNGLDNRRCNLRLCTHAENMQSRRKPRSNTSGFKGVYFSKHARRWRASICTGGRSKNLGYYDDPREAHAAYLMAAQRMFGEFAKAG